MRFQSLKVIFIVLTALLLLVAPAAFGQTSGSISGTVLDQKSAVVPGATVRAVDTRTNLSVETFTSDLGTFSFASLQPSNYTIEVELPGFKKLVKTGIILEVASKLNIGTLILEIGGITETVSVSAEAAQLQIKSTTGEIGEVVTGRQVLELALNGRNFLDLMKLVPGVRAPVSLGEVAGPGSFSGFNINGTRTTMHNLTIDGSTNVDTGSNGTQHVMLNMDAIAEFKVMVSNYQAEFGRSAGGDIKIFTRSGGSRLHGTGYIFHRHEGLNANSWSNNAQGRKADGTENAPRNFYRYNYAGFNVGGPVVLPRGLLKDKLFFFGGQEYHRQLVPQSGRAVRVPTALEVAGDFSKTTDGYGVPITITNPYNGKPFEGNKIPATMLTSDGVAILKLFSKHENATQFMPIYNHYSQQSISYPRRQDNIRVDYRVANHTTIFVRLTQDKDEQVMPYGLGWTSGQNFPLTPTIFKQGPARNGALNVTTNLSPTLVNEFIFGPSQNNLTLNAVDPNAATLPGLGLKFKPPFPYSPYQFINLGFSGTPNQSYAAINAYDRFPYKNSNTTFDVMDNLSKVWSTHLFKAGFFVQRNRKDQAAGGSMTISHSHNVRNPNNTGHPYANALLGEFEGLTAPKCGLYQGQYRYTNWEWYLQDNWKLSRRLTLDYGVRMYIMQPQYDQRLQDSYFDPGAWDPKKAVRLYIPGPSSTAIDPANPTLRLPSYLQYRIVPGSGDPFNGMRSTQDGHLRGGIKQRGIQWGPRFGFAYDIFGNAKTILRGGYGIFFDRVSGNALIFPAAEMPPIFVFPTFNWGNLATVGAAETALAPVSVLGADPEGQVPNVQNFSLQIQRDIGLDTVISVGYVGSLGHHLQQVRNLNYIPYGTTFERRAQDATRFTGNVVPDSDPTIPQVYKDAGLKFDGSKALDSRVLRRYPGYTSINYREFVGSSNYHSMQVTVNRKFTRNLTYALAYTWSKAMDTADGDGTGTHPENTRGYNYGVAGFDRKHIMSINYVWNLPKLSPKLGGHWLAKGIFDDWEVSGISQFQTGSPSTPGYGTNPPTGRSTTGSPDLGARALITGDPRLEDSTTKWFDYTMFRMPDVGSKGVGPINTLRNPGIHLHDISVFKNFPLPGGDSNRRIQIRLEMFNAFNHPQFSGFNGSLTWQLKSDWSDYKEKQQANSNWIQNVRGGAYPPSTVGDRLGRAVGEVSGGSNPRVVQLAAKIYF